MKFIISSVKLLKSLQALSGVINSNNTLPILDNFLFSLSDEDLNITASDLETTMTITLTPDLMEGNGEVAIPARILLDIMKTFPDIPVTINISNETLAVELITGEGHYKLSGYKSDEFPQIPVVNDATQMVIDAEVLASGFEKTIFATGTDELRPIMSGVFVEMSANYMSFVATDAHKLVRYRRMDAKSTEESSLIIPKKPINQLKNILAAKPEEKVLLEFNQTNASFSFDNFKLICRLIEGRYPNYDAVIPTSNPNKLTIDRLSLLNSIRRVAIFSSKATHQVRFKIAGQELVLSAEDLDYYNEAKERLTCSYVGDDMEIGFNSRFFQEMLSNITNTDVLIEMSTSNRAGIITPIDNANSDEDILMLIMPVMLNQ